MMSTILNWEALFSVSRKSGGKNNLYSRRKCIGPCFLAASVEDLLTVFAFILIQFGSDSV